jgi:dinuclear metal center YbgI/SA1388 family protein
VTTEAPSPTLGDVVAVLERMYDPRWARDWDAVGLVCGDPETPVRRVLLAVDPAPSVIEEALAWRADLIVTHHPLLLRPVHGVPASTQKGRVVHQLVRGGCALYTAHTNADVAAPGVSDALARVLGLTDLVPLSADDADPMDKIVTFVPEAAVEKVIDALAAAGAGELGEYQRCAWTATGTGTFVQGPPPAPLLGMAEDGEEGEAGAAGASRMHRAHEADREPGERESVDERRIEMVLPRQRRGSALAALRLAHPYADPAIDVYELAPWSGPRGIGRVGTLGTPTSLREFAMLVAEALPGTAQGVRVAGEPTSVVQRVAVCGGAGDSLFDAVRGSGADVFVTADLRHHPASELRDRAGEGPPYLVDVAHWASEWPWCEQAAAILRDAFGGNVDIHVSTLRTDPWTVVAAR